MSKGSWYMIRQRDNRDYNLIILRLRVKMLCHNNEVIVVHVPTYVSGSEQCA